MYKQLMNGAKVFTFKRFNHHSYAAFSSMRIAVCIGVLSVSTLTYANAGCLAVEDLKESQTQEVRLDEVSVTGTLAPLSASEQARIVRSITREEIAQSGAQCVNDVLKMAVGVDVRQRGGFGVQTDISINGGSFDQTAILLNGVNINNPQSGHLSADFPVTVDDIERIEVLEGAASRIFGASAFSGAINIVTRRAEANEAMVTAEGGSYGTFGGGANVSAIAGKTRHRLSGGYRRSDGGTENSDFDKFQVFYNGGVGLDGLRLNWQGGVCKQDYGANTFYSAKFPNQHEANSRYFASVGGEWTGIVHLLPCVYWNRSYDHFELIRGSNSGENFHRTDVYGVRLNGFFDWVAGRTSFGTEVRNEGILSTNLGKVMPEEQWVDVPGESDVVYDKKDNRTNVSVFAEHNVLWRNVTLSVGCMANMNTAYDGRFHLYPGVDVSYRPDERWKLFASWDMALRMPTFTDLYYKSPTQEGNVGLHPEETQSVLLGVQYRPRGWRATANGFYHKGKNMIDWVMYGADDVFHSTNFKLDNMGFELQGDVLFTELFGDRCWLQSVHVGYAYIHQRRKDDVEIYKSNYALEYLRHKVVATLSHRVFAKLEASWSFRWQERMGSYLTAENVKVNYRPFSLIDLKIQWNEPSFSIYATVNNLTNYTYYDLGNVAQPGCWVMVGGAYKIRW